MKSKIQIRKLDVMQLQAEVNVIEKGVELFQERREKIVDQEMFIDKHSPEMLNFHINEIEIPDDDLRSTILSLNQTSTLLLLELNNDKCNKKALKDYAKKVFKLKKDYDAYDKILDGQEDACSIEIDYLTKIENN